MSTMLGQLNISEGFKPVDLQTAANDGDWVSMEEYDRIVVLFLSAIGTAADDPTLTIEQADTNAGGNSKGLNFTRIYTKQAATDLSSTGVFTVVTQTAASTYTEATAAEQDLIWAVEFKADELDVANGFDHIRGRVADVGTNAQLGVLLYLHGFPRKATETHLSPL